jgi:hypothetical protein
VSGSSDEERGVHIHRGRVGAKHRVSILDRVVSSDRSDTASHADGSTIEQQTSVDDVPHRPGRSDVHLAAQDRVSEIDEMRSEVSASTVAYCHSSQDSVRRALAKTRR